MQNYDVIIFGGGTAGCACAWNCGRLGLKTLLIEKEAYLGGTMTGSLVIPIMKSGDNQINTDFYNELVNEMHKACAQVTYQGNSGWFNPFILKTVLLDMLHEAGVDIHLGTEMLSLYNDMIYSNNTIIRIETLSEYIEAKYFVDATGNLDFCEKIGCKFLPLPDEFQPMNLRFIMDGVDLKTFGDWLLTIDSDRNVTAVEEIDGQTHLSTAYTWDSNKHWALAQYFEKAVQDKVLKDTDRNYFQVFTVAGMKNGLAFNCPRIVENLNPLDKNDLKTAYNIGKEAIERIANFCKLYFPGFNNAYIYKIADEVGIRASRQIKGKYIYTIEDLRSSKNFENPAVISSYPVDVHSRDKNSSTLEANGEYQLPIESLMSNDFDNLYVAGRGLSADKLAQGALRVQASCFSMGEAIAKHIKSRI